MHVTVVGAGALGRVYGVRLAAEGARVAFVVRPSRLADAAPFAIEQVSGAKRHDRLEAPRRVADVPAETDVVLVTVRFDQLDADLAARLRAGPAHAPAVVLTPLLPAQRRSLDAGVGRAVVPAMPGVTGYLDDREAVRYWSVPIAATMIDDPGHGHAAATAAGERRAQLETLAREMTRAHLPARLERDVGSLNAATTTAFFPLIASIDAAGGIDGVLADKELVAEVLEAAKESEALARRMGKVAPWAGLLTRFVGPFTIRPGIALARRLFPEAVHFVEAHFGAKLHAQHVAMGEAILALGREHGAPMPALERLMARLATR